MRKSIRVVALAAAVSVFGTGCFGSFQLVKAVYGFNEEIENKWAREAVFLALAIFPVYGLAALGDVFIFNTIEFWGGEAPKIGQADDGSQIEITKEREGVARVRQIRDGAVVAEYELEQVGSNAMQVRQAGKVLVSAEAQADGAIAVTDASGLRYYSASRVAELRQGGDVAALASLRADFATANAMTAGR